MNIMERDEAIEEVMEGIEEAKQDMGLRRGKKKRRLGEGDRGREWSLWWRSGVQGGRGSQSATWWRRTWMGGAGRDEERWPSLEAC